VTLSIPPTWWSQDGPKDRSSGGAGGGEVTKSAVNVSYSFFTVDRQSRCEGNIEGALRGVQVLRPVFSLGFIALAPLGDAGVVSPAYLELKEDRHILIYVPQTSFPLGARFRVPVKLQASSDLRVFVTRYATYLIYGHWLSSERSS